MPPPLTPRSPDAGQAGTEVRGPGLGGARTEMWIVTGLSAAVYLAAAVLLDFVYRSFADDAVSRLANGFYVLYSRDPHLAAIGFVWTPLTSMADFVPLLLKPLWPVLATHAFAGSVVTVAAMAAAVHQLRSALLEWGVARTPRVVLTLLFALNPMIVFFAANGMSEALLVFTLLATTRYLLRWMRDEDDVRSLVYAGVALAFAYLARNETLAAVALSGALVFTVSALRVKRWRPADEGGGKRTSRYMGAMTDTLVYVAPFLAAFLGWLGAAYLIVKDPFQQFHANAALVQESGFRPGPMSERLSHELNAVIHLMPLLPLIALGALVVAWRRRDAQVAVPIAVIGGPLAFDLIGYASGQLFPWLRYYILAIPIGVLLLGYLLSPVSVVVDADAKRQAPAARRRLGESRRLVATAGGVAVVVLALGPSLPASALGMVDPTVGVGETIQNLGFIFHAHPDAQDRQEQHRYDHVLAIGAALTAMHLPHGSVLVDNDVACIPDVLTTIADNKVFVIPNDRDFQKILADPLVFHAHYLLAPVHSSYPDLVNNAYPDLSLAGNGVTTIVRTFPAENGCDELRLYRVVGHPSGA